MGLNMTMMASATVFKGGPGTGKTTKLISIAVDAIKNGLQVEEWLMYDTKGIPDLLK